MGSLNSIVGIGTPGTAFNLNDPLGFAGFGLDRPVLGWRSMDADLPILHLGPGYKQIIPSQSVSTFDLPDFDLEHDTLPYPDDSVGGVVATHVLEHLADPRHILREVARVLKPYRPFNILVPHADSLMAKQDLDHKSQYVLDTWRVLLENPYYDLNNNTEFAFKVGVNFCFGIKEGNLAVVTQLIKVRRGEA